MRIKEFNRLRIPYNRNSLFFKGFIKLTCFVLALVFIVSAIIFSTSLTLTSSEFISTVSDNATKLNFRTDEVFTQMKDLCNFLSLNESVRFFLLDSEKNPTVNIVQDKIMLQLSQLSLVSPYINSIYVYNETNQSIFTKEGCYSIKNFSDNGWISSYNESGSNLSLHPRKMHSKYPYVITFIKKIKLNTGESGAVILNLDTKTLFPELHNSQVSSYIIDTDDKIIFSNAPDLFLTDAGETNLLDTVLKHRKSSFCKIYSKTPHAAAVSEKNEYGFRCVCILDISDRTSQIFLIQLLVTLFCVVLLLIAVFFVYSFSLSYYTPFSQIRRILDNPLDTNNIEAVDAETQYIAKKIIENMNANEALRTEISNYIEQTSKLRIHSMQSQLNPHFLYNTMNIINLSLVKKLGVYDESIDIVNKLSLLMRYAMDLSSETTTVRTEIKHSRIYTDILKIRSGESLTIKWDIDENILNAKIPKLCFQPLIENAFSHGLIPSNKDKKLLRVSGKKENDLLLFTIEDTGTGIPEDKFIEIKENLKSNDYVVASNSHIGISNVNGRIKLIFGEDYGIDIESTPGIGTKLFIKLPFIEENKF